jgi:hypothetical protein
MSGSLVSIGPESLDSFRVGAVLSCLLIGLSYLLP